MDKKQLRNYLIWAFGLAWVLQGIASWFFWQGQGQVYQLILVVVMYTPFAAVLLAKVPLRGMGWKPRLRGKLRTVLAAWLAPALLGALGAALYYLLFPSRLDLTGAYLKAQLGEELLQQQLDASGLSLTGLIAVQTIAALTYAPFTNMFAALGEEVGWRGALYPALKKRLGTAKGRLLGGLIWGAWHWPIMLLAGYEYGLYYWGAPVLGMLLFCLFATAAGVLLDHLYEKSGCIWVPALGHGAINAFAGVPILVLDPVYANQLTVGPLMVGILGGLPLLLAAAWLLLRDAKNS